jgi:RNA polymerase sigma-70 factor (ECF subfamily)
LGASAPDPREILDRLVREQAGQLVASLTRILGSARLDLAQDCVQEALLRALRVWSFEGVPARPAAWLVHVAKNVALDAVRRERMVARKEAELEAWAARNAAASGSSSPERNGEDDGTPADDVLRLMFLCCHPALPRESRVALTLKTVAGLHVAEIARAFLADEAAIHQRLLRAKRQLRQMAAPFELPRPRALTARLDAVLEVLYLLFTEGYAATRGEALTRPDLACEAIRLGELLAARPELATPRLHALLALMHFHAARLPARTDELGELRRIAEQDRARHDRAAVRRGFHHLERAMGGAELSAWHAEAGIAAVHAAASLAPRAAIDWPQIVWWYDRLLELAPTPVVALNRPIAIGELAGPAAALPCLAALDRERALRRYALLPAARGEFLARLGREREARKEFARAARLAANHAQRRWLERRAAGP